MIHTHMTNLVEQECIDCGVFFMITKTLDDKRRIDKKAFYCPSGHGQTYQKSMEQLLTENLRGAEATIRILQEEVTKLSRKKNKK